MPFLALRFVLGEPQIKLRNMEANKAKGFGSKQHLTPERLQRDNQHTLQPVTSRL